MSSFSIEQMAELLIERIIRGNVFGLTEHMSPDMLTDLTMLDTDELEKNQFGHVDKFLDLHASLRHASETTIMDERAEAQCLEILSDRNIGSHKDIEEYLDRHLSAISHEPDIVKLGTDINLKVGY